MRSLSPSSAHRWVNCPGSAELCEDVPYTSSEAARIGVGVAAVIEYLVKDNRCEVHSGLKNVPFMFEYQNDPSEILITPEVVRCVDFFLAEVKSHFVRLSTKTYVPQLWAEKDIDLTHIHPNMRGRSKPFRSDVVIEGETEIVVLDYKNGYIAVRIEDEAGRPNEQLLCYAAGELKAGLGLHDKFTLVIVQPNSRDVPPVQEKTYSSSVIYKYAELTLAAAARLAMGDKPLLHAGSHCRFCPAIAKCPEIRAEASRQSSSDFAQYANEVISPTAPEYYTDEAIARVLSWLPIFNHWSKEVAAYAERKALGGTKFPGYKLVRGRGSRSWPDDALQQLTYAEVNLNAIYKTELRSPHEMELAGIDKKTIAAIAIPHDGALTLVPDSDKRTEQPITNGFEGYGVS